MRNSVLIVLLLPFLAWSQSIEFDPVTAADFKSTALSGEKDYDALVLNRLECVFISDYFGFSNNKVVHERILIVKEEGLSYATEQIPLYVEGDIPETVKDLKGTSYNLVNGKIVTSELEESAIFTEEKNDKWKTTTFTMPSVTQGTIIDFSYTVESPYAAIDDINIQYNIPINNLNIIVQLGRTFMYNIAFNPHALYRLSFDKETIESSIRDSASFDETTSGTVPNEADQVNEILTLKNETVALRTIGVPALVEEPMAGGMNRYRAKLLIEVAAAKRRDGGYRDYATDWNAVAKSISKNDRFGEQLNSTRFFRSDLSDAVDAIVDEKEKAFAVLKFLKSKVKWNGNFRKLTTDGVKDAYKKGSGNSAEVNLLLTSMLKKSGLEAYPVLVSSINKGTPLFPTQDGFDYVISQVVIDGEKYLLDGTATYSYFNIIPERAANWKGRVIKSKELSEWVDLETKELSKEIVMIAATLDDDFNAVFETKSRATNYSAFTTRSSYDEATDREIKEYLERGTPGLVIDDFSMENYEEVDKPLNITYSGTFKNGVNQIGDKLYVKSLLYEAVEENPFKLEKRTYPLKLSYPREIKNIVNLRIPEGYEVESIPESVKLEYNEGVGGFSYLVKQQGNIISTVATFTLTTPMIEPYAYESFRKFFISIVDKNAERIVLKKIP